MNNYFDYAATTPLAPEVSSYLHKTLTGVFGNPSSVHRAGQQSRILMEESRDQIAAALSCSPAEIIFTSGGTEANNLALKGVVATWPASKRKLFVSAIEHPSVLETAEYLRSRGIEVGTLPVNINGEIDVHRLSERIGTNTGLISAMLVNNETGVIQPIEQIAKICRQRNILFHCDAVQAFGKLRDRISKPIADLITISGHKIYGPKGVGALYVRKGVQLQPLMQGGGQEANRRPGTENLYGILGFGKAVEILDVDGEYSKIADLQKYFESQLRKIDPNVYVVGAEAERSPYITCASFVGKKNDTLLYKLDMAGVSVSIGSACSSGSIRQSHVLQAMGLPEEIINGAIRFSFGRYTTQSGMDTALDRLTGILNKG